MCHSRHLITAPLKHLRKHLKHVVFGLRRLRQCFQQVRATARHIRGLTALLGHGRDSLGRLSRCRFACLPTPPSKHAEGPTGATSDLRARVWAACATSLTCSPIARLLGVQLVSALHANHQSNILSPRTVPRAESSSLPTLNAAFLGPSLAASVARQGIVRFTNPQHRIRTPTPIPASMLHRQLPPDVTYPV